MCIIKKAVLFKFSKEEKESNLFCIDLAFLNMDQDIKSVMENLGTREWWPENPVTA